MLAKKFGKWICEMYSIQTSPIRATAWCPAATQLCNEGDGGVHGPEVSTLHQFAKICEIYSVNSPPHDLESPNIGVGQSPVRGWESGWAEKEDAFCLGFARDPRDALGTP